MVAAIFLFPTNLCGPPTIGGRREHETSGFPGPTLTPSHKQLCDLLMPLSFFFPSILDKGFCQLLESGTPSAGLAQSRCVINVEVDS